MKIDTKGMAYETVLLTESWYSWPQEIEVPAGCWYRTDGTREFTFAEEMCRVNVFSSGDIVEVVSPEKNLVTRYEVQ